MVEPLPHANPRRRGRPCVRAAVVLCALAATLGRAEEVTRPAETERLTRRYQEAHTRFDAAPSNAAPAIAFARAVFELTEFATNSTQRAALAEEGIAASRVALSLAPTNAAAHCVLGLNLGQLARTRTLGALKLVPQIEAAWLAAAAADPQVNHAAPRRLLALLYDGAPGWPLSVGSRSEARTNFVQAIALAPDYANNWLVYLESCLGWGDLKTARAIFPKTAAAMAKARQLFPGREWVWELQDWERRWAAAQKKFDAAEKRARNTAHRQRMKDD